MRYYNDKRYLIEKLNKLSSRELFISLLKFQ